MSPPAVTVRVPSRAGLMGNPSDGYGGKALAVAVDAFFAEVTVEPADRVELVPGADPSPTDLSELVEHVERHGYHGARRLLLASARAFAGHLVQRGLPLPPGGFRMSWRTTVPRQLGLAGSSALVVAALEALGRHFGVPLDPDTLPTLALEVETRELGIPAGLMDRVVQVWGGLVHMDLTDGAMHRVDGYRCGVYRAVDPALLPPLFLAWRTSAAEPTEAVHGDLARRFRAGDPAVLEAVDSLARGVDRAMEALQAGDQLAFTRLVDANFDLRRSVSHVAPAHARMVEAAREAGAAAKFAGSGGAIVGVLPEPGALERVRDRLAREGCQTERLVPGPSRTSRASGAG